MKITNPAIAIVLLVASSAHAQQAVQWKVSEGGNGHWYQLASNGSYLCWSSAEGFARAAGGHLVSENSEAEHDFVATRFVSQDAAWSGRWGPWIGGRLVNGAWTWTTGEPWTFNAWQPGEPNGSGSETVVSYIAQGEGGGCGRTTRWNNWVDCAIVNADGCDVGVWSYLIEWDADCNNDGIVDYGQCRDGSLPDYNGNNIPDCCENGQACIVGNYPVQWRAEDGGNDHWYQLQTRSVITSWGTASSIAAALGGYLATPLSDEEDSFTFRVGNRPGAWNLSLGPWLGGYQDVASADFSEPAGGWQWVTGEPWQFTNWQSPQPDNGGSAGDENRLHYIGFSRNWNDIVESGNPGWSGVQALIIEWSADCNNDGIVDKGQILQGQLADLNSDGVPDICQQPTCVDADIYRDFNVNGADLGILLSQWGPNTPLTESDLNKDGAVDGADLGLLLSFWGPCP